MNGSSSTSRPRRWAWAALSGVVSAAVFLAAAEVVALLAARESSPLLALGSFVVDVVPQPIKELAISAFGEYDKIVLLLTLAVGAVIAAAGAGMLQLARPPWGIAAFGVAGAVVLVVTVTRPLAGLLAALPPTAGALAGALCLRFLTARLRGWASSEGAAESAPAPGSVDRRVFLRVAGIAGATALLIGTGARLLIDATTSSVAAVREKLRLPAPRSAVRVPSGAELDIPGLSPLITPNADFYRVDTALTVPSVDPATWRLVVNGMVEEPLELTFDDLLSRGLDEYAITLTCVSNEVGGSLVGNAIWLGVPVRDILRPARPTAEADMVLSRSVDGFTASTPLESLTDDAVDAILAVGMNGDPLPLEHGFPVRMVVPGLYGYVSATKWLTELTVTRFDRDEAYWTPRGYSAKAPIKFSSRLDTPRTGAAIPAGPTAVAGVAWAQTAGIERVEVSIDDGPWEQATLSTPISDDTWVQWVLEWDAQPGTHYITVRAVDRNGDLQLEERAPIAPDGSAGWQRTLVRVT